MLQIAEIRLEKDCYVGEIIFLDMKELTFEDILRFNPSTAIKAFNVYKVSYFLIKYKVYVLPAYV